MSVHPSTFTIFYWLGAGPYSLPVLKGEGYTGHVIRAIRCVTRHRKHTCQTWPGFSNFSVCKNHLGESVKIKLGFLGPILRVSDSVSPGCGLGICFAGVQLIFHLCLRQGP